MDTFTPVSALTGGALIGLAAALLILFNGRIAGISGILSGLMSSRPSLWRILFILGLILGSWLATVMSFPAPVAPKQPEWILALAGILVGLGTSIGGGCTSGHGICGLGRLSKRSLVATVTFIAVAMLTVWISRGGFHV